MSTAASRSAPPACFLVMESQEHAEARGAKPYAKLTRVVADLAQRKQAGRGDAIAGSAVVEARRATAIAAI